MGSGTLSRRPARTVFSPYRAPGPGADQDHPGGQHDQQGDGGNQQIPRLPAAALDDPGQHRREDDAAQPAAGGGQTDVASRSGEPLADDQRHQGVDAKPRRKAQQGGAEHKVPKHRGARRQDRRARQSQAHQSQILAQVVPGHEPSGQNRARHTAQRAHRMGQGYLCDGNILSDADWREKQAEAIDNQAVAGKIEQAYPQENRRCPAAAGLLPVHSRCFCTHPAKSMTVRSSARSGLSWFSAKICGRYLARR